MNAYCFGKILFLPSLALILFFLPYSFNICGNYANNAHAADSANPTYCEEHGHDFPSSPTMTPCSGSITLTLKKDLSLQRGWKLVATNNSTPGKDTKVCSRCSQSADGYPKNHEIHTGSGQSGDKTNNLAKLIDYLTEQGETTGEMILPESLKCFPPEGTTACSIPLEWGTDDHECVACSGNECSFNSSLWNFVDGSILQDIPLLRSATGMDLTLYSNLRTFVPEEEHILGPSWCLSFSEFLVQNQNDSNVIINTKPNGKKISFVKSSAEKYESVPNKNYVLSVTKESCTIKDLNGNTTVFGPLVYNKKSDKRYAKIQKLLKANSSPTNYEYNERNLISKISFGNNIKEGYILSYNKDNKISELQTTSGAKIACFIYNTSGYLDSIYYGDYCQPHNPHYKFTYSPNGRIISKIRPNGGEVKYEYDKSGELVKTIDANGATTARKRDGNKVAVLMPNGEKNEFTVRTGSKHFSAAKYANGREVKNVYNMLGQITEKAGGCKKCDTGTTSMLTKYKYNDSGKCTQIEYFGNGNQPSVVSYKYDENNRRIAAIDAFGNETQFKYDEDDHLVETIHPDKSTSRTEYDAIGNVVANIDARGNKTTYVYDKAGNQVEKCFADGTTEKSSYDYLGRRISMYSAGGELTNFRYDLLGYMIEKIGPVGDRNKDGTVDQADLQIARVSGDLETWTRDTEGNPLTYMDRNGNITKYEYDGQWKLIKTTYPDGSFIQVWRDPEGKIIKTLERNGSFTFNKYNELGMATEKIWDTGRTAGEVDAKDTRVRYQYSTDGELIAEFDRNGNMTSYEYDDFGRKITTINPLGYQTRVRYDQRGNVIAKIDGSGNETLYAYDSNNRLISKSTPNNAVEKYEYDGCGNLVAIIAANGVVTRNVYDEVNRLIQVVQDADGLKVVTAYTYDKKGRKSSETRDKGGLNLTTKYDYNDKGKLSAIILPDGIINRWIYDNNGNVVEDIVEAGVSRISTLKTYNNMNLLVKTVSPAGLSTTISYDESGRRFTVVQDPDGLKYSKRFDYNELGKITQILDNSNGSNAIIQSNQYDSNGNLLLKTDGTGKGVQFEYNSLNQNIKAIDSLGNFTTIKYDKANKLVSIVDQNGHSQEVEYDSSGMITKQLNEQGEIVSYAYDEAGNRTSITDKSSNISKSTYDAFNRPTSLTYANGDTEKYVYDRIGQMIEKVYANGNIVNYSYDKGGRITRIKTQQGVLNFTYDAFGRKIEETDNTLPNGDVGKLTYEYDTAGRMVAITDHNVNQTVKYEYDKFNRKTKVAVDNNFIDYRYNNQGLLSEVQKNGETLPTKYEYDKASRRTKLSLPNGVWTDYTYDKAGRLTAVITKNKDGIIISGTEYILDRAGNRTSMRLTLDGQVQIAEYSFDVDNRLTGEKRLLVKNPALTNSEKELQFENVFTYDVLGNRLSRTHTDRFGKVTKTVYVYNNTNQLLTETANGVTKTYLYDKNGNTVEVKSTDAAGKDVGKVIMTYDWLNRQSSWSDGTITETHEYRGAEWNRIKSTAFTKGGTSSTIRYLYDGVNVIADIVDDKVDKFYVSASIDDSICMVDAGHSYYYVKDGIGSTSLMTDNNGNVVSHYDYNAHGELVGKTQLNSVKNRYLYAGRETSSIQSDVAPMYYRWRMYTPSNGRFVSRDPIAFSSSKVESLYVYPKNPLSYNDPLGLVKIENDLVLIANAADKIRRKGNTLTHARRLLSVAQSNGGMNSQAYIDALAEIRNSSSAALADAVAELVKTAYNSGDAIGDFNGAYEALANYIEGAPNATAEAVQTVAEQSVEWITEAIISSTAIAKIAQVIIKEATDTGAGLGNWIAGKLADIKMNDDCKKCNCDFILGLHSEGEQWSASDKPSAKCLRQDSITYVIANMPTATTQDGIYATIYKLLVQEQPNYIKCQESAK